MKEDNEAVIKALNMFGRVPEQWELLNEIERLNNIINELERKMLNDKLYVENISKKQPYPIEEFRIRNPYTTGSYDTCINYLDKLQELRGSNNNE